jgi:hypothetical protein
MNRLVEILTRAAIALIIVHTAFWTSFWLAIITE